MHLKDQIWNGCSWRRSTYIVTNLLAFSQSVKSLKDYVLFLENSYCFNIMVYNTLYFMLMFVFGILDKTLQYNLWNYLHLEAV